MRAMAGKNFSGIPVAVTEWTGWNLPPELSNWSAEL